MHQLVAMSWRRPVRAYPGTQNVMVQSNDNCRQLIEGCARIHAKATLMLEIERKGKFQMLLAIMAI